MNALGTVLLALLFPIGWGLLTAWGFDSLRARWSRKAKKEGR